MKIKYLFVLLLSIMALPAFAQRGQMEDVIYLKDETVTRGTILSRDEIHIKIQTAEGNIHVYNVGDIIKINREPRFGSYNNKKPGYAHYTELGPLVAGKTTIDGVTTAAFSFQTVNGYRFRPCFFSGAGIGADLYATQTILPVFASVRGDLLNSGSLIPFYFADAGYGINITQNAANSTDFRGGAMYAAGAGVKIPFNRNAGFLLSFAYRHQATAYNLNGIKTSITYNRLAVRAGFFF